MLSHSSNPSRIEEIEPEEEPIVEVVPKLSEVKEEEDSSTWTSIELDPEDELCDEMGKGLDFNPAVSLILRSFVP